MASIRERNGSYQITVSCGYDINGKKLLETATFTPDPSLTPKKHEKTVQEFAQLFESKVKNGLMLKPHRVNAFFVTLTKDGARHNSDKPADQQPPHIPFHSLLHSSVTLLISGHQDLKTVSKRLGHAQTSTTMNIYAHALQESDRKAADALGTLLEKHPQ